MWLCTCLYGTWNVTNHSCILGQWVYWPGLDMTLSTAIIENGKLVVHFSTSNLHNMDHKNFHLSWFINWPCHEHCVVYVWGIFLIVHIHSSEKPAQCIILVSTYRPNFSFRKKSVTLFNQHTDCFEHELPYEHVPIRETAWER